MSPPRPERVGPGYLALFASLYAVQGVVLAYFLNFNQLYMTTSGVARGRAADIQSLALVPFILKFLGGPLSDRVNFFGLGHRKPYIVLGLAAQSIGLVGLAWLDPGRTLGAFGAMALFTVAGLALYDTCCDGMVIDVTPPGDRARVQGILVASRALAAMICSFLFGMMANDPGEGPARYHRLLWTCAALGLLPLAQAIVLPEPKRVRAAEEFNWAALRVLLKRRSLLLLAFGAIYSTLGYGVEINLSPYYQARKFTDGAIGALGSARFLGRAVGAGLLTVLSSRLGRGRVLAVGILALALTTAAQAAIGGPISAGLAGFGFGVANGWDDAVFFVLAMEAADPRMAASTYALFMAVTNISIVGGSLVAHLNEALGGRYAPTFLIVAAAVLIALPLARPLRHPATHPELEPAHELAD
jgi:PAT family beta-lactamase induction signal transducer AmpG